MTNYDFATLNAKLTGASAAQRTRDNRPFADDDQMYTELLNCKTQGKLRIGHRIALRAAHNAGLLSDAPLTKPQHAALKRNKNAKLSRKVELNADGERYLEDLRAKLYAPKPCTALVVAGHWERLTVQDTINQAQDAMFSILIRERASTYSMVMA